MGNTRTKRVRSPSLEGSLSRGTLNWCGSMTAPRRQVTHLVFGSYSSLPSPMPTAVRLICSPPITQGPVHDRMMHTRYKGQALWPLCWSKFVLQCALKLGLSPPWEMLALDFSFLVGVLLGPLILALSPRTCVGRPCCALLSPITILSSPLPLLPCAATGRAAVLICSCSCPGRPLWESRLPASFSVFLPGRT